MNDVLYNSIKLNAEEIMKITYPLCEHESSDVALRNIKVNNLAHEIKDALSKLKD